VYSLSTGTCAIKAYMRIYANLNQETKELVWVSFYSVAFLTSPQWALLICLGLLIVKVVGLDDLKQFTLIAKWGNTMR
jgi:hypothetical protein